jgi:sialic acid synthase SpsE
VRIGPHILGDTVGPFMIAEIGVNHEGSLDRAKRLIDLAKAGGAHAAKFQTYKAESLASQDSPAYWDTTKEPVANQRQLFAKHDSFGLAEYEALAAHCRVVGIEFLSTPFDLQAVEWLEPLVNAFKVASADLTNTPLLRRIAKSGKPILLSTGAATLGEIDTAIVTLEEAGAVDIVLLHCVLAYPCPYEDANLGMIGGLRRAFPERLIGYSDHTVPDAGMKVVLAAWLKGAVVIEKHFTDDKTLPGNDHYHAMNGDDLARFTADARFVAGLIGSSHKHPLTIEEAARLHARRSVVAARPIAAGEVLSEAMLTTKRPAHGVPASLWDQIIGRRTRRAITADTSLKWDDLD